MRDALCMGNFYHAHEKEADMCFYIVVGRYISMVLDDVDDDVILWY